MPLFNSIRVIPPSSPKFCLIVTSRSGPDSDVVKESIHLSWMLDITLITVEFCWASPKVSSYRSISVPGFTSISVQDLAVSLETGALIKVRSQDLSLIHI